jgi:methylmalonyl-CoA mutase
MYDLLQEKEQGKIKIFGGGACNSTFRNWNTSVRNHQIYAPDDGRAMGLQGMITTWYNNQIFLLG